MHVRSSQPCEVGVSGCVESHGSLGWEGVYVVRPCCTHYGCTGPSHLLNKAIC